MSPGSNGREPRGKNRRGIGPETEEPMDVLWDRLASTVDAFEEERPRRVLRRVRRADLDPRVPFPDLTQAAHEAISKEMNEELRQVLTTIQQRLELNLASPSRPTLTRKEGYELLMGIREAAQLLDAHLLPDDIAKGFLVLDEAPIELAETMRFHLRRQNLSQTVETSLEAAPVEADPWLLGEAVLALLEPFLEDAEDHRPCLSVEWEGENARVFVGTRPPLEPAHGIQEWLDQAPRMQGSGLNVPMACAVLERQDADVAVHETDDGAVGLQCTFPALERGPFSTPG